MLRSPSATLKAVVVEPRSADLAALILAISACCSVLFLLTAVGRLAGLDQAVRQLESFGIAVTDAGYAELRAWQPYRPVASAAAILAGWPVLWLLGAGIIRAVGNGRGGVQASFAQVLTVMVHASSVLAVRSAVSLPINFARESIGGATSMAMLLPGFGESTLPARVLGALDVFVLWWIVLLALGLGILYRASGRSIARWLFAVYGAGALALALTQALRGGV